VSAGYALMMSGMSIFSLAICFSRALSDARSGEPGAYDRMGSFTGGGTRRWPLKAEIVEDIALECSALRRTTQRPPSSAGRRTLSLRSPRPPRLRRMSRLLQVRIAPRAGLPVVAARRLAPPGGQRHHQLGRETADVRLVRSPQLAQRGGRSCGPVRPHAGGFQLLEHLCKRFVGQPIGGHLQRYVEDLREVYGRVPRDGER